MGARAPWQIYVGALDLPALRVTEPLQQVVGLIVLKGERRDAAHREGARGALPTTSSSRLPPSEKYPNFQHCRRLIW